MQPFVRLAALLSLLILSSASSAETVSKWLTGVNLAGGEFGGKKRGRLGIDYKYPTHDALDLFRAKGFSVLRVPFKIGRVAYKSDDEIGLGSEFEILVDLVQYAQRENETILLDLRDDGTFFSDGLVGESEESARLFARAWFQIASRLKLYPNVIFGLMNEPTTKSASGWLSAAQGALLEIRRAGCRQLVLVPGILWSGAHSWTTSDNARVMGAVHDPQENFAYDIHQYLDADSSGTTPATVPGSGASRLRAFTAWARSHGARAFLSEFAWAPTPEGAKEGEDLLRFLSENKDVWIGWTYWAAGPMWRTYFFSVEPKDGIDRPQMTILRNYQN